MRPNVPVRFCLLILLVTGLPAPPSAAEEPVSQDAVGPVVTVRPIEGGDVRGYLTSLDDESLTLRGADGASRSWSSQELESLAVRPRADAFDETAPRVLLANDDVLNGTVRSGDEETLTVSWAAVNPPPEVAVPLEAVRSFVIQQPEDELERIVLRRIWALLDPTTDRLISTDNTHVDGELMGLSDERIQFKSSLGTISAPVQEVVAVITNSELRTRPEPEGLYRLVTFRDGSRLSFSSLQAGTDGMMRGTTLWGGELSFPLESAARIQFLGGRVVSLTDLTPAAYEFTPYLTQRYPLVTNRNVKGGRLRLRGQTYAIGLGVSSKSEVTYDLAGGGYRQFRAVIGVDDMTDGQGNVVFAVDLDGRRVYKSRPLSGRSPAETVGPLDVSGARTLKLTVDFGQFGNIQDVANWCDPVLTRGRDDQ